MTFFSYNIIHSIDELPLSSDMTEVTDTYFYLNVYVCSFLNSFYTVVFYTGFYYAGASY